MEGGLDPEQPIYSIYHGINRNRNVFETNNLGRRIEAELGRESSTRDQVMDGNEIKDDEELIKNTSNRETEEGHMRERLKRKRITRS